MLVTGKDVVVTLVQSSYVSERQLPVAVALSIYLRRLAMDQEVKSAKSSALVIGRHYCDWHD